MLHSNVTCDVFNPWMYNKNGSTSESLMEARVTLSGSAGSESIPGRKIPATALNEHTIVKPVRAGL